MPGCRLNCQGSGEGDFGEEPDMGLSQKLSFRDLGGVRRLCAQGDPVLGQTGRDL